MNENEFYVRRAINLAANVHDFPLGAAVRPFVPLKKWDSDRLILLRKNWFGAVQRGDAPSLFAN